MSWTLYTDRLVAGKADLCAIHGKNGEPWAQVSNFKCSTDEVMTVVKAILENDHSLYSKGAFLGGKKWTVIRMESDSNICVLKGKDRDNQKQTMVVAISGKAVVLGANSDENTQGAAVRAAVEELRDYLKTCSY